MTPTNTILEQTAKCFTNARQNLLQGAEGLYKISSEELWKGQYETFGDFVEEECRISQSSASKLIQTYKYFVIENAVSQAKLEHIDQEKLYLALRLPGSAEKKLATASTLTRSELRRELKDPNDECQHQETITICKTCNKRME